MRKMIFVTSLIFLFLRILTATALLTLKDAPCHYIDTIPAIFGNETHSTFQNEVPNNATGIYDYEIPVGNQKIKTDAHVRGCVCDLFDCISICCPFDKVEYNEQGVCQNPTYSTIHQTAITNDTGESFLFNFADHFVMQIYRPCAGLMSLIQSTNPLKYSLFENGTMLYKNKYYSKNEFCLSPFVLKGYDFYFYPMICSSDNQQEMRNKEVIRNSKVMIISVPFMLVTILVYLLPRSSTLHVKSTCIYLLNLSVAFTTMPLINLMPNINDRDCSILGHTTYFTFIASYSWLTVVSYDLFKNITKVRNPYTETKKFIHYSLFGWGTPTLLLLFILIAQGQNWEYKANIASSTNCFFEKTGNKKMIYFYVPGIILISLNVIMFLLTGKKVSVNQPRDAMRKKIQLYVENCGIFARLGLTTGVAWIFEFLTYCFPETPILKDLIVLVKFQGYIIFLLTILSKSVRDDLKKLFQNSFGQENSLHVTKREATLSVRQATI